MLALSAASSFAFQPLFTELARAQVISDPAAPIQFRPGISATRSGTPLVNIVTPSVGGVSHNKYGSFNVDTRGLILNNSGLGGTSIIGGAVPANPNLVGQRPASVIVNEVTGSSASALNGPTEVFGSRADVIVANPNGVACTSCSFLNAGKVTLSTGVPIPNYRTGTVSFEVRRGTVSIQGTGVSGADGQALQAIDLIGRQIKVEGAVTAKGAARLRAGAMTYDASGDVATAIAGSDVPPVTGLAISTSSAGTIRAGTISVLSKDLDLGVSLIGDLSAVGLAQSNLVTGASEQVPGGIAIKSAGDLLVHSSAATGDLDLDAAGRLTLAKAGRVDANGTPLLDHEALGRITLAGHDIAVETGSQVKASDRLVAEALGSLTSGGQLSSGQAISLIATEGLDARGSVEAGGRLALEGRSVTTTDLQAKGSYVSIAGIETVQLGATHLTSASEAVITGRDVTLGAGTDFSAPGTIRIRADRKLANATAIDAPNIALDIGESLQNDETGVIVRDDLLINLAGDIWNAGLLYGRNSTSISANNITNTETGTIHGGHTTVAAQGDLNNRGAVLSDGALSVTAQGANSNDGSLKSNARLTLRAASYKGGGASVIEGAEADLKVITAFENSGHILGRDRLALSAETLANMAGAELRSGAAAKIALAGDLFNAGQIGAVGDLTITGVQAVSNSGQILSQEGNLQLKASGGVRSSGAISASKALTLLAASYEGLTAETRLEGGSVAITLGTGDFTNAGQVLSTGRFDLTAGRFTQAASGVSQGRDMSLHLTGDASNAGAIRAAGDLKLDAPSLTNAGQILADGQTTLAVRTYVSNSGKIVSTGDLALTAASLTNDGSIRSSGQGLLALGEGAFINAGEALFSGSLSITAGLYSGAPGSRLEADGTLDAAISGPFTNAGTVQSAERLAFSIKGALSNAGSLQGKVLALGVGGDLSNGGQIVALDAMTVTVGGRVDNTGRLIAQGGDLGLTAGGIVASSGDIIAKGRLALTAAAYETPADTAKMGGANVVVRLGTGHLFNLGQLVAANAL
ncbi:filamentous hemagglutinin N-terminal domain-containing protein, partial [Methylobacterium brachiatum]|uniref:two-partner secretion domain-containing protein n=1 Tax=Methylobacterium brachiatum TaxID=269660 RepID=UPI0008E2572E